MKKQSIFYKIKRWWYKMQYSESRIDEMCRGKFRALYKDGQRTHKMFYKNAKTYAGLFGGEVIDAF